MEQFNDSYKVYKLMKYVSEDGNMNLVNFILNSPDYGLQKKLDGSSYIMAKDLDGSVHLYKDSISKKDGKLIDKIDNVPHIKKFIETEFPCGSQIIAELYYHYDANGEYHEREESKYLNSIMLALPKKAQDRQKNTELVKVYMFDILFWNQEVIYENAFDVRDAILNKLAQNWIKYEWLTKAETFKDNKAEIITSWLEEGCEGGVLKKLESKHYLGDLNKTAKRPTGVSMKIKQMDTTDLFVTRVIFPEKEYQGTDAENYKYRDEEGNAVNRLWYKGMICAFEVGALDDDGNTVIIGTVASGLNDEIRLDAAQHPENYIGKVAVLQMMSLDRNNRTLRHPRFAGWHMDKEKEDCRISDIFNNRMKEALR